METQSEAYLKAVAQQLACPEGDHGIKTGALMNVNNIGMTHTAISAMNLTSGQSVLEIGPGNASHVEFLLGQSTNIRYSGVDISETMIQEARRINAANVESNQVSFIQTDGEVLPFENQQFDHIFTVNTIYFWESPQAYLKEIKRVLKPSGMFTLSFADQRFMEKLPFTKYGFRLYLENDVKALLINAGLNPVNTVLKTEEITSNSGQLVNRDYYTISSINFK